MLSRKMDFTILKSGQSRKENSLSFSLLSESPMLNKDKIWLYHHHLGHPSFGVLKVTFPLLFKEISVEHFHHSVCELTKYQRASFQISNKRTAFPFSLIHSDIWGPSTIPNIYGTRWFVSFIDDCTHVTWIYLLKNKSDVCLVIPISFNMVKDQLRVEIRRF